MKYKWDNSGCFPVLEDRIVNLEKRIEALEGKKEVKAEVKEELYPCSDCGKLRTKAEGGTTFTVCEACWDKHYIKLLEEKQVKELAIKKVEEIKSYKADM